LTYLLQLKLKCGSNSTKPVMLFISMQWTSPSVYSWCWCFAAGLKRCLRGGLVGFGLGAAYCLYTSKDHLKRIVGMRDWYRFV